MALATRIRRTLTPHGLRVDVLLLDRSGVVIGESWRGDVDAQAAGELRAAASRLAGRPAPGERRGDVTQAQARALGGLKPGGDPRPRWGAPGIGPLGQALPPGPDTERPPPLAPT